MTFVFENEPNLEDNYLDPNNDQDLQKIILILQKLPSMRTKAELKSLYLLLTKIDFLKDFWANMPSRLCFALLKALKYEHVQKALPVFKHGDDEKHFYLILKGSVYVIIPTKEEKDEANEIASPLDLDSFGEASPGLAATPDINSPSEDKYKRRGGFFKEEVLVKKRSFRRKDSMNRPSTDGLSPSSYVRQKGLYIKTDFRDRNLTQASSFSAAANAGPLTPEGLLALYPNHVLLNTLKERDYFGEIALKLHTKRTATIVTREVSHFLILDGRAYNSILSDYQDRLQHEMLYFFKSAPLTKDWPSSSILGLMKHFKVVNPSVNNVIYNIGDPISYIYFIKQGEVEIIKETDFDPIKDMSYLSHRRGDSMDKTKVNMISMNSTWRTKYVNAHKQQIRVALLGPNQNFGEEEFLTKRKTRQSKAIVKSSAAEIIMVPTSKLIENAKDPDRFRHRLATKDAKAKWRESLENEIIETSHTNEFWKKVNQNRSEKTIITVTDNNFSGLKKPPPQHSRFPSLSVETTENPQPGAITRLMQQELDKKSPFKHHNPLKSPRQTEINTASKSPPSSRLPKSPEMLKKLLNQTFQNMAFCTRRASPSAEASQQNSKDDSLSVQRTISVSKMASATQSLETSHIFTQDQGQKQGLTTVDLLSFLGSSPSMSHLQDSKFVDTKLKTRGGFLSPLRQTGGFSKMGKAVGTPHSSFYRGNSNEPKVKKLLLNELDPVEQKLPPQMFINSPKLLDADKVIKDSVADAIPFFISPKIKINASSPKLVMKIKNKMKSLNNSGAFLESEALGPQKVFDISKLNQLICQKGRRLNNRSVNIEKKRDTDNKTVEVLETSKGSLERKTRIRF